MGQIQILDENMVNMIAAGEVVERPASVVKELLENSIDSGAKKIVVSVEDGGRKLISVSDDGCGMDSEDLAKAFMPHATSKIKTSDDLHRIATMGFRGEALASIAAVAQVRGISRTAQSLEANVIEFDCGTKTAFGPTSGACGTTIEVRELFYKLPARRKFLRTANTEMTHITEQFTRIALACPYLDLTLLHNGREIFRLVGGQSIIERIGIMFSSPIAESLLELSAKDKGLEVFGFLGRPDAARASGDYQYTFLNGRCIKDKFISHAIKEAYRGMIEPGKFPVVFLFLKMPCEAYDVNVHPTKIEVRFDNPNLVHSQVLAVMREKLLSTNLDTLGRLPQTSAQDIAGLESALPQDQRRQRIAEAMAEFFKESRPSYSQQQFNYGRAGQGHSPAVRAIESESDHGRTSLRPSHPSETEVPEVLKKDFLQIHDSYIVAQNEDGFIIIDQHALHERILYEELCRRLAKGGLESQKLLLPESIEITDSQSATIERHKDLLTKLGIVIESFGPKAAAIQSFPSVLGEVSPAEFVQEMLDVLADNRIAMDAERLLHEVLDMAACKAAVKAGQKLNSSEIEKLLADKEAVERAARCPHGRPTVIKFTLEQLRKQFKRT